MCVRTGTVKPPAAREAAPAIGTSDLASCVQHGSMRSGGAAPDTHQCVMIGEVPERRQPACPTLDIGDDEARPPLRGDALDRVHRPCRASQRTLRTGLIGVAVVLATGRTVAGVAATPSCPDAGGLQDLSYELTSLRTALHRSRHGDAGASSSTRRRAQTSSSLREAWPPRRPCPAFGGSYEWHPCLEPLTGRPPGEGSPSRGPRGA